MKKIICLCLLAIIFISFTNIHAQTKISLRGGLSLASMVVEDNTFDLNTDNIAGFHGGFFFEFPVSDLISLETGISASKKGFKTTEDAFSTGDYEGEIKLLYLDVPANAKVNFQAGNATVFGMAGPYIGYGLSGESTEKYTVGGMTTTETLDVEWGSDEEEDDLIRLDYGLLLGAGINIGSILASVSYELGLANISTYTQDDASIKNRVLKFSVGFIISGNTAN